MTEIEKLRRHIESLEVKVLIGREAQIELDQLQKEFYKIVLDNMKGER